MRLLVNLGVMLLVSFAWSELAHYFCFYSLIRLGGNFLIGLLFGMAYHHDEY